MVTVPFLFWYLPVSLFSPYTKLCVAWWVTVLSVHSFSQERVYSSHETVKWFHNSQELKFHWHKPKYRRTIDNYLSYDTYFLLQLYPSI